MRHHTQHRFSEWLDSSRKGKFFIFGEIQAGFALGPGRWCMQIRGPDLVLAASWNREIGGAEQFPHLLRQAEFPEVFGGVHFRPINSFTPFIRKKVFRGLCWELAPSFRIHPLECLNGLDNRLGGTGSRECECPEQVREEGTQKRVMMVK